MNKQKTADVKPRHFVRGPAITPPAKLRKWIERRIQNKPDSYFRLPLVLRQGQEGYSLRGARIGAVDDAIEVDADDAALGIGLADHAWTHCKKRPVCAFQVEGRFAREPDWSLRLDVLKVISPLDSAALDSVNYIEIETEPISEAGSSEQGIPLPQGARRNASLQGATTLASGRNYVLRVFDVDYTLEAVTEFYRGKLPDAKRTSEDGVETFATPKAKIILARNPPGTRITLAFGPQ